MRRKLGAIRQQQIDLTARWYVWLGAAAVLFAFGCGVLVVAGILEGGPLDCDDADGCLADSILWAASLFSWLAAIVTGGIGIIMGVLRWVVHHRAKLT
jgi:hypothetical protein